MSAIDKSRESKFEVASGGGLGRVVSREVGKGHRMSFWGEVTCSKPECGAGCTAV